MADTGLRVALVAYAAPGVVVSKNEVRTSSDALVTASPASWAIIDNADPLIPQGKFAWVRQRG
jgi:hypothetical protein